MLLLVRLVGGLSLLAFAIAALYAMMNPEAVDLPGLLAAVRDSAQRQAPAVDRRPEPDPPSTTRSTATPVAVPPAPRPTAPEIRPEPAQTESQQVPATTEAPLGVVDLAEQEEPTQVAVVPISFDDPSTGLPIAVPADAKLRFSIEGVSGTKMAPADGVIGEGEKLEVELSSKPKAWLEIECTTPPTKSADDLLLKLSCRWERVPGKSAPVSTPIVMSLLGKLERQGSRQQAAVASMESQLAAAQAYLAADGAKPIVQKNQAKTAVNRLSASLPGEQQRLAAMQQSYRLLQQFAAELERLEGGSIAVSEVSSR
ncbi:hypothetical protein [Botrimarina sp.]|uniref:hypothetical protein n=1 Tax=Botrimarina sp. TaxID=2795802 RepID=UPI0032ED62B6